MRRTLSLARTATISLTLSLKHLLIAAAIFHFLLTLSVYSLGHYSVLPTTFDTNGIAVSFAPDGISLRDEAAELSRALAGGQFRAWLTASSLFHIKLYSICFTMLGPLFGETILSAEPLSLFYYLMILVFIFYLGQELLDRRAGVIAAATIALWPSFLLHTTQPLKDLPFTMGMLAFVLIIMRLLSRSYSWPQAVATGAAGGLLAVFIWLTRDSMGELLVATVVLATTILIVQQAREKHFRPANVVGMILLMFVSISVTRVVPEFRRSYTHQAALETKGPTNSAPGGGKIVRLNRPEAQSLNPLSRVAARVGTVRQRFVLEYPDAASNVDSNVQLNTVGDLVHYLPRAAVVGFFAPFPNKWFADRTHVGLAGRLLSGLETLVMYIIEGLAVIGLWGASGTWRRRLSLWLLGLIASLGIISLGLVVVNVGALYRLRYVFLFMLMILGAGGATYILDRFKHVPPHPKPAKQLT